MNRIQVYILLICFFIPLFTACGIQKQEERERVEAVSCYEMKEVILDSDSGEEEISLKTYRKLRQIDDNYYLLEDNELSNEGTVLILDKNADLEETIVFKRKAMETLQDIYILQKGKSFFILSVKTKDAEEIVYLSKYDWSGKLLEHRKLGEISVFAVMEAGVNGIWITDYTQKNTLWLYNYDAELLWEKEMQQNIPQSILEASDGFLYGVTLSLEDSSGYAAVKIDPENGNMIEKHRIGNTGDSDVPSLAAGNGDFKLYYYSARSGIYGYQFSEGNSQKIIDWIGSSIDGSLCMDLCIWNEDSFLCLNGEERNSIRLQKLYPVEEDKREVLTIGLWQLDNKIGNAIIRYNQENSQVRMEVKNYSEYHDSITQFQIDVSAGQCPDIVDMNLVKAETMLEKGLLEDLYPFMKKDKEISPEKFFSSILNILEWDGALYAIPASVCIRGLACSKEVFSGESMEPSDVFEIMKNNPQAKEFLYNNSKLTAFTSILSAGRIERFFETEKGEKELSELLSVCGNISDYQDISIEDIKRGKVLFYNVMMNNPALTFAELDYCYGKGSYSIYGYPAGEGSGIFMEYCRYDPFFGISASCSNQEAAWQFIRTFLTKEWQEGGLGIPVRKDALESVISRDGTGSISFGGTSVSLTCKQRISDKKRKVLLHLIDSVGYFMMPNSVQEDLRNIMYEEVQSYFDGDRTKEDTIEVMKNRVRLYGQEQR